MKRLDVSRETRGNTRKGTMKNGKDEEGNRISREKRKKEERLGRGPFPSTYLACVTVPARIAFGLAKRYVHKVGHSDLYFVEDYG